MKNCGNETEWRMIPAVVQGFLVAFGSTRWSGSASRHAPFAPLEKWKKLFSNLQKQLFRVWTTRCHMLNNQMLRPASGLEWNPWLWMQFLQLHKKPEKNSGLQWGLGLQTLLKSWIYFRLLMQLLYPPVFNPGHDWQQSHNASFSYDGTLAQQKVWLRQQHF